MAYLDTIKAGAVSTWRTHQVLPSVVGAQAALESGWGTSRLAKPPYNNQFGIKASDDWTGRTVIMPTREYRNGVWVTEDANFRAYDSAGDSVRDHGDFFTSTPWREDNYKDVVGETDYKKACWALQNAPAPYATDTGYAQKLINLIENNNLQAWDIEALADNSNTIATQAQQTIVSKMVGADLTDAGKQYVRDLEVTMIGDSLGVGTKPYFESLVPKANYDVLGSRQITHATNSLNGTYILQQMKNSGTLKEYVVVILGTNRGVTEQEVNNFASIAGDNHKVIFVDTASEVAHINTLSVYYQDAAKRLNNVYFANWRLKANSLKPQYYSKDGANGEYIHMTPLGYQKHAEFIAQALYEVATANFTDRVAEATKVEFYTIENFELNEDGLITYDAWRVNSDGTSTKHKATKQTAIKGLYSPYGESNIYNPSANQQYGLGNSVNNSNWRETYFEDSEETDGLKLVEKASAELIERQEPEMIYTVNLLEIPVELSIGDTGIFVDHEFNPPLYIRARVLSITTSETNANLNKVTIGNVTELQPKDKSALMAIRAELQETRKDLESSWIGSISTDMTIVSTNGYVLGDRTRETSLVAKVFKGKDDITDQYEVFTWERISEDTAKDTAFNNALAETIQSSVLTVHEKDVIGNQSKFVARAFNATGELISHQEIVIKRVETALWTDTGTAPPYAIDGATWTKPDGSQWVLVDGVWEEKVNQAQMFTVKADIDAAKVIADNAKAEADDARQRAEDALTEAGISTDLAQTAKDLAQLAEDNAETALTNAQTAINEAGIAASQAVQAINTADTAKTNAQTALSEAGNAKTTANNLSIRVDDVEAEVELKASQTIVDGLSGTVSNHSTTLTQHANQIASKADSSVVNIIKGTVDTHTTEIAQNATEISSKASSSSVNTLTGRVDTAETTITQHATAIQARLTSAQVDSLVDGKNLAKVTYVDSQITATAEGFGSELTRVEGKIPQSYTEENLVQNSKEYVSNTAYLIKEYTLTKQLTVGKEYTIVLEGGIGSTGSDQKFGIYFDNGHSFQESLVNIVGQIYKKTFTLVQSGSNSGDKSKFRLYNLPNNTTSAVIKWIKLVEGSVTDNIHTPSMSDLLLQNDFTVFKNTYQNTVDSINTELSKTAKTTDLNGMVTESVLATKQFVTQGSMTTTLSNYAQTDNVPTNTQFNQLKNSYDSMVQTIGTNGSKIAQMVMTDSLFSTKVLASVEIGGRNYAVGTTDKMQYNQQILGWSGNMQANTSKNVYTLADLGAKVGDTYTASIYIAQSGGFGSGLRIDTQSVASKYVTPKTMHDFATITFTVEEGDTEFRFYYANTSGINALYKIEACKFQIEKGNKRTDWNPSPLDKANQSEVTQLANNWAVRMLNSKNDIVSQINLSDNTFLIEAKNIVGLGDAVINGKLTVTGDMIAGTISADKISGGTLTGTTFVTTENATGFSTRLYNGAIEFRHQIFTLGHIHATTRMNTEIINGFAVVQRPGYIFSINSKSNLPNNNTSTAVLQVPAESTSESRKLNIFAQGGFRISSDTLSILDDQIIAKKPLQALGGFMASHAQTSAGASINDAGNLIYSVDKADSVMVHRFMVRRKDGTWPDNGLAIYEDGRVAVVVNGVWKQL